MLVYDSAGKIEVNATVATVFYLSVNRLHSLSQSYYSYVVMILFSLAIDPCHTNNGSCPPNSRCNYLGPGKVSFVRFEVCALQFIYMERGNVIYIKLYTIVSVF